jgi:rare lipoprotein A (peptidoglycan hydrolase)
MAKNLAEYNRLTADLATTHADVSRLTDQLYDLRQSLKKQQGKLSELAARRYETGGLGFLDVLVGARTWRQLAIGMDYVDSVAQQTAEVVDDVKTTRAQTERVRTARKERESRITSLRRDVKAQRLKIVKEIAQQQASLDSLDSRIVQMVNEQERAAQSGGRGTLDVPVGGNAWMNASSLLPGASAKVDGSGSYLIPGAQPTRYQTIGLGFDWTSSTYGNADNTPPNSTVTASSRPFHETELTCANKILPFGTLLAVSNAGRRVIVVVSDRGPYIPGRALDLSTAAANAVGLPGVGGVHVEIVLPE